MLCRGVYSSFLSKITSVMIQWHPVYLGTVTEDGSSQLSGSHHKPHHDVDFVKM